MMEKAQTRHEGEGGTEKFQIDGISVKDGAGEIRIWSEGADKRQGQRAEILKLYNLQPATHFNYENRETLEIEQPMSATDFTDCTDLWARGRGARRNYECHDYPEWNSRFRQDLQDISGF